MESIARLRNCIERIASLEKNHSWHVCQSYPPGRCPLCFEIRQIEQDEIEKEVTILEENVMDALEHEKEYIHAFKLLVEGDIIRCHRNGKWPYSDAEIAEQSMLAIMLSQRLELLRIYAGTPLYLKIVREQLVLHYQRLYKELRSRYWSDEQTAQYPHETQFIQGFEYVEIV